VPGLGSELLLDVELRDDDPDGDEMIVATIFSYRRSSIITKRALV
jgi:hypothetical protein